MKKTVWAMLVFVAALLTGCPDTREVVNFDTDPRVLRGSWDFVLSDRSSGAVVSTQKVEFTPTFVSESSYSVTASLTLEAEVYALNGWINEFNSRFIRPQRSPIQLASLWLTGSASAKPYIIVIEGRVQYLGRWRYFGWIQKTENGVAKFYTLEVIRN